MAYHKTQELLDMENHINYIEFKALDLEIIKDFYSNVFGWNFTYYGESYTSFSESGVCGGFEKTEKPIVNGVLVVLYYKELEIIKNNIEEFGCKVSKEIFSFPGGRRFHFLDPSGNELAVWSDK